ncbi:hypothetical protein COL154_001128 [Colletotrichum chrysophilum]|nr:hypothetical protein COL154_001128 [Colletotrichum chrysophilum]
MRTLQAALEVAATLASSAEDGAEAVAADGLATRAEIAEETAILTSEIDAMDLTEMREVASENATETGEIGKATEEGRVHQAEADHRRSEIFETEILR